MTKILDSWGLRVCNWTLRWAVRIAGAYLFVLLPPLWADDRVEIQRLLDDSRGKRGASQRELFRELNPDAPRWVRSPKHARNDWASKDEYSQNKHLSHALRARRLGRLPAKVRAKLRESHALLVSTPDDLVEQFTEEHGLREVQGQILVDVIAKIDDAAKPDCFSVLKPKAVQRVTDRFWVLSLEVRQLPALAGLNEVLDFSPAKRLYPESAVSFGPLGLNVPSGAATSCQNTGAPGVNIGVIDTGLDLGHPDFRLPSSHPAYQNGSTRNFYPKKILEQTIATSSSVATYYPRGGGGLGTPVDYHGHGTMVSSIATGKTGIAYNADLLLGRGPAGGNPLDASLLLMVTDFLKTADPVSLGGEGRPCVVNLSLGRWQGLKDGKGMTESALSDLIQGGLAPGKAIVVSAGNNGVLDSHVYGDVPPSSISPFVDVYFRPTSVAPAGTFDDPRTGGYFWWANQYVRPTGESYYELELHFPYPQLISNLEVEVIPPQGSSETPESIVLRPSNIVVYDHYLWHGNAVGNGSITAAWNERPEGGLDPSLGVNRGSILNIKLNDPDGPGAIPGPQSGRWKLRLRNSGNDYLKFDAYSGQAGGIKQYCHFLSGSEAGAPITYSFSRSKTLNSIAAADGIIAVGSYILEEKDGSSGTKISNDVGQAALSSAFGPVDNFIPKPDVFAPGQIV